MLGGVSARRNNYDLGVERGQASESSSPELQWKRAAPCEAALPILRRFKTSEKL